MKCPHCGHEWTNKRQAKGGKKGGKAKGKAKARTSEQARAAINARWERYRQVKAAKAKADQNHEQDATE